MPTFYLILNFYQMACDFKYLLVTHAYYLTFAHSADVVPFIFADSHDSGCWSNKG